MQIPAGFVVSGYAGELVRFKHRGLRACLFEVYGSGFVGFKLGLGLGRCGVVAKYVSCGACAGESRLLQRPLPCHGQCLTDYEYYTARKHEKLQDLSARGQQELRTASPHVPRQNLQKDHPVPTPASCWLGSSTANPARWQRGRGRGLRQRRR